MYTKLGIVVSYPKHKNRKQSKNQGITTNYKDITTNYKNLKYKENLLQ